jgi:hypothetical protein
MLSVRSERRGYLSLSSIAIVLFFATSDLSTAQPNVVTFENCSFKVSDKFFFPIGWYGGGGRDLGRMKKDGASVVVQYWDGIMRDYSTTDNSYPFDESDLTNYQLSLKRYLDDVQQNGLKVFVHLPTESTPTEGVRPHLIESGFIRDVIADSRIRNHPALLGWYHGDEVDLVAHEPTITYEYLKQNYDAIKSIDVTHPVFLVFWGKDGFLDKFSFKKGRIYDVLGTDRYAATVKSNPPALNLGDVRDAAKDLAEVFYSQTSSNEGSMLFVCQGYGYRNIDGRVNPAWDTLHSFGFRNPTATEVIYSAFSPIYWTQREGRGNLGGLLFWDYDYADSAVRATVGSFIRFFTSNELGTVIRRKNELGSAKSTWPLVSMLRRLGNAYYLLTINEGVQQTGLSSVELTVETRISTIEELAYPEGATSRKRLTMISTRRYRVTDRWDTKQVRVFKLY